MSVESVPSEPVAPTPIQATAQPVATSKVRDRKAPSQADRETALLTALLGPTITYYPAMARLLGGQGLMWTKAEDPDGWVLKSTEEWEEATALNSEGQLAGHKHLRRKGVLEERQIEHRLYFRIKMEALYDLWAKRRLRSQDV